jgi:hypothetical protein
MAKNVAFRSSRAGSPKEMWDSPRVVGRPSTVEQYDRRILEGGNELRPDVPLKHTPSLQRSGV